MRLPLLLLVVLAPIVASGCGDDDDSAGGEADLTVVATTTHAADLARQVAGDRAAVDGILSANADPHAYEPRPSDAAALGDADLVVRSGGDLDQWLDELVENAGADPEQVTLIDSVETVEGHHEHEGEEEHAEEEHADEEVDPHWWQDPRNAVLAVDAIRKALVKADPEGRAIYDRNAAAYQRTLRRLDSDIERCIERVPPDKRKVVTTHDALGYFANRYGIEVIGAVIPSLSTQAQPSAKDVDALVGQIESEGVEAIFPEAAVSQKLERAISREAGAEVGGTLWADSLGPDGSGAETYVGAMRADAETLAEDMSGGRVRCGLRH
jgi:ABC-type Zn uptake system ZnuABC Zn-binding protein ZnuA